ncbi:MAG: type II toxin-antitoxin system HicA family toxin [Patescibacteria group bacterium]
MQKLTVKTTDCSCEDLLKVAKRCGFIEAGGKKHCKIKSIDGQFITTIPRHKCLSKDTVKGILKRFNQFGAEIAIF